MHTAHSELQLWKDKRTKYLLLLYFGSPTIKIARPQWARRSLACSIKKVGGTFLTAKLVFFSVDEAPTSLGVETGMRIQLLGASQSILQFSPTNIISGGGRADGGDYTCTLCTVQSSGEVMCQSRTTVLFLLGSRPKLQPKNDAGNLHHGKLK